MKIANVTNRRRFECEHMSSSVGCLENENEAQMEKIFFMQYNTPLPNAKRPAKTALVSLGSH